MRTNVPTKLQQASVQTGGRTRVKVPFISPKTIEMMSNPDFPKFETTKTGPISAKDQPKLFEYANKINVSQVTIYELKAAFALANGVELANGVQQLTLVTRFFATIKDKSYSNSKRYYQSLLLYIQINNKRTT